MSGRAGRGSSADSTFLAALIVVAAVAELWLAWRYFGFLTGDDVEILAEAFRVATGFKYRAWDIRCLFVPDVIIAPFVWLGAKLGVRDVRTLVVIATLPSIVAAAISTILVHALAMRWTSDLRVARCCVALRVALADAGLREHGLSANDRDVVRAARNLAGRTNDGVCATRTFCRSALRNRLRRSLQRVASFRWRPDVDPQPASSPDPSPRRARRRRHLWLFVVIPLMTYFSLSPRPVRVIDCEMVFASRSKPILNCAFCAKSVGRILMAPLRSRRVSRAR
jgi:hypothetical protein